MPENDVKVNVKYLDEREWTGFIWQSRNKWQASVNTVLTFGFCKMWGISCLPETLYACAARLHHGISYSMHIDIHFHTVFNIIQ
jgi:hypothetical protein